MDFAEKIAKNMTLDELCGQVLCYLMPVKKTPEEAEEIMRKTKPGGVFVYSSTPEDIENYTDMINKYTSVPVIVASDAENGPAGPLKGDYPALPYPMAWGACDDETLIESGGVATARICRQNGIHWTFSPLVDINYNKDNPVVNTRAIADSPTQVAKMAGAFVRGIQKEGLMAASCKHFPGDGMDDRNQHFCTTLNTKSREEWMDTYGYVFKKMIEENVASIMVAHIAAPAFQEGEYDEVTGWKPASLSYRLITELLKGELGYRGCVVSDALSMIGAAAAVPEEELVVDFIKAGGDMALFALPEDFDRLKNAVHSGKLSRERLEDAAARVLRLKKFVGLTDGDVTEVEEDTQINSIARNIAEKSIKIIRNHGDVLPVDINTCSDVLICNLINKEEGPDVFPFDTIEEELKNRGISVRVLTNVTHRDVEREFNEKWPDLVLVNCRLSSNECNGGSLRCDWSNINTFWRGLIFRHPRVVFTSFGDPYKLYEFPYLPVYVNAFSPVPESQKAFIKVLFGEIEAVGKSPVELPGFFEREV